MLLLNFLFWLLSHSPSEKDIVKEFVKTSAKDAFVDVVAYSAKDPISDAKDPIPDAKDSNVEVEIPPDILDRMYLTPVVPLPPPSFDIPIICPRDVTEVNPCPACRNSR